MLFSSLTDNQHAGSTCAAISHSGTDVDHYLGPLQAAEVLRDSLQICEPVSSGKIGKISTRIAPSTKKKTQDSLESDGETSFLRHGQVA